MYDFRQLSPHDFERLVRDLLQAQWSQQLESFKTGRDGGVDLRYAKGAENLIVQVKHYVRTGFAGLTRDLANEDQKLAKLKPSRYVIATSVPLSPGNKSTIAKTLPSAPLVVSDILGQDDLNNLLGIHPTIEKRHPKLWLTSRAVFDQVLHNAEITRSEFEVRKIHQQIRRYVQTEAFREAERRLGDESVVMVSGPPGIGKTILANMLLYEHLSQGWQAVVIDRDIVEGARLFQRQVNQVFYFDDFIGATLVGEGVGATDKALLNFIALVRDDPTSRLILTTREHLYEQAATRSERLREAGLDADRVVLRMPRYTTQQRAQILYNHIYFSELPNAHVDALLEDDFYREIIRHKRYNPRVIEWMASHQRIRSVPAAGYQTFIRQLLENPLEIWRHAYEEELSHSARSLLLVLWSREGRIGLPNLKTAFLNLHAYRANKYRFERSPQDFSRALKELNGSFINPKGRNAFEVSDPSVLDLIAGILQDAPDNFSDLLISASFFSQIERLWTFARQKNVGMLRQIWRDAGTEVAPIIKSLMLAKGREDLPGVGTSRIGPTYERRLAVAIEVATRIGTDEYRDLVEPIAAKVMEEPVHHGVDIGELVDLIVFLEGEKNSKFSDLARPLRERVFEAVKLGCPSDEFSKATHLLDNSPSDGELNAFRMGYSGYLEHYYNDELSNVQSSGDFARLIDALALFRDVLDVQTDEFVAEVEKAHQEFEEGQEWYAEAHLDEYKERWREERIESESIADMFAGLRVDRTGKV